MGARICIDTERKHETEFWTKDMCGQIVRTDIIKEKRCGQKEGMH